MEHNGMLTNREIVDIYLENGLIQTCVDCQFSQLSAYEKQNKEDFFQDLIVILLTYDNAKLNDAHINNHFNALVSAIIIRNLWSRTSQYYKNYKKFSSRTDEITEEMMETIDDELR